MAKYLDTFRRAAREAKTREKSEVSEKRGDEGGLNSLTSLISHPEPPQNPSQRSPAACAQCGAGGDLWHLDTPSGPVLVHQECAAFLPKAEPAPPSAAVYDGASAGPEGGCRVQIVELPPAGRYRKVFGILQTKPPALVPVERWRLCVSDGSRFLAKWGEQAEALNWTSADLFGLHQPPDKPHPSYSRLSRYDCTGLCWLLRGRPVIALTESTAAIENITGNVTVFRKNNRPGLGPVGDSLDDFIA